jgi:uncharacterized phiE125 gp8 family phage protein
MALQLIEAPTEPAVPLEQVKAHLRVAGADDDDLIGIYLDAAIAEVEHRTGRALMSQTWRLSEEAFPCELVLARVPVLNVASLTYIDQEGIQQTLADTEYKLDNSDYYGMARIRPAYGKNWPSTRSQPNAVQVDFEVGYEDAEAVPAAIRSWIMLQVGAMYENREAESTVQTYALGSVDRLLDRYKVWGA